MVSKELFIQIQEFAKEKGFTIEESTEILKKSLEAACKKVAPNAKIIISLNPEKNELRIFTEQLVVSEYSQVKDDNVAEILLEDAKLIKPNAKVGDILRGEINPKTDLGRQNARSAKSSFTSGVKSVERKRAYNYFKELEGEMIVATVIDKNDRFLTLDIGQGVSTILPVVELLPNDLYEKEDKIRVYVKEVEETTKDPKVKVSRTDRNLIIRLMEDTIPEIKSGVIEIMGIARDPGSRTKIAVKSNDPKVDPLGSCVGESGNRINEVVNALNGEKIDLYKWSEDPEELIAQSLQPAKVTRVMNVDKVQKTSLAIVPDDQLSLAIGKAGQNVRLAVQSCGWKIDIKPTSEAYKEGIFNVYEN